MSEPRPSMTQSPAKIQRVVDGLEELLGAPAPPEKRTPPLDMLIATVLSQNTNDLNSHRAYTRLREKFPTWDDVLSARRSSIASVIRIGGMAEQKSETIREVLRAVKKRFGALNLAALKDWLDDEIIEYLTSMNGVGMKTAACVLLFSLGRDVCPVDTHVSRICERLGLSGKSKSPEKIFGYLRAGMPPGKAYSLHLNLIRFGRKICRSSNPHCGNCPFFSDCRYSLKDRAALETSSGRDVDFMLLENV